MKSMEILHKLINLLPVTKNMQATDRSYSCTDHIIRKLKKIIQIKTRRIWTRLFWQVPCVRFGSFRPWFSGPKLLLLESSTIFKLQYKYRVLFIDKIVTCSIEKLTKHKLSSVNFILKGFRFSFLNFINLSLAYLEQSVYQRFGCIIGG